MELLKMPLGELEANCYILKNNNQALIIDCGSETNKILEALKNIDLKNCAVLLTHGHFDHCGSAKDLSDLGVPIYIHELDKSKLETEENLSYLADLKFENCNNAKTLTEGNIKILDFDVQVIHTPGHSAGSVCYIVDKYIFTGDTYFFLGTYGRTDLPDGDYDTLVKSLIKLKPYLKNYKVCAGH